MECSKCVMDDKIDPNISFDSNGVCSWCTWQDEMVSEYQRRNWRDQGAIIDNMKDWGIDKQFDCVLGLSGGVDSSFLLHRLVYDWDLRPLCVSFADGFDTTAGEHNVKELVTDLDVKLITVSRDQQMINQMYRSTLYARVIDTDAPTDIMMMKAIHEPALKHGIRYLLDAHNYQTEATTPVGTAYFDGRYVVDLYERYVGEKACKCVWDSVVSFRDQLRYLRAGLKKPRLMYYEDYTKANALKILKAFYDYQEYPLKHGENYYTVFSNYFWWPKVFGFDFRQIHYSAMIRSGQMDRSDATKELETPAWQLPGVSETVDLVGQKLGMDLRLHADMTTRPTVQTYKDFKTYLPYFHALRPVFWAAMKRGMVPASFYDKYCRW